MLAKIWLHFDSERLNDLQEIICGFCKLQNLKI